MNGSGNCSCSREGFEQSACPYPGGLDVFGVALHPQRPQGLLGTGGGEAGPGGEGGGEGWVGGQVHLIVFHTAPELCGVVG